METVVNASDAKPFGGVVALDGPSGTGKSTVARRLAARLGARYLDTGAMYRAVTVGVLESGAALDDPTAIAAVARLLRVSIKTDPASADVRLGDADVTAAIRMPDVTAAVSAVSAVPEVRTRLVALQRELIDSGGIVVEGRDIGSVVWPTARTKVYLTAAAEVRAARRAVELGPRVDVDSVAADIARRDRLDSTRSVSPAIRPDGSVELDSSTLSIDEVVQKLADMVAVNEGIPT